MKNKTILITGSNQGIGFDLAKYFCKKGNNVIICARNKKKLQHAHKVLNGIKKNNQIIFSKKLDISSEKSVDIFFKKIFKKFRRIDVLINNAGIYGPKGMFENQSWKDWKKVININLLGSIYVIKKIVLHFKKKGGGKIIQIAGGGAASSFPYFTAYSSSKVSLVRFIENISIELKKKNIFVNSVAPGPVNTRMLGEALKAGPKKIGLDFYKKSLKQKKNGGTNLNKIRSLISFLSSKESNGISGRLISAQWDNWKLFKLNKKKIAKSDLGTLRRVAGRDRKMSFFDL